jgi:hypothetical protein
VAPDTDTDELEGGDEPLETLLAIDPELDHAEHAGLRRVLGERYARSLELFRVG